MKKSSWPCGICIDPKTENIFVRYSTGIRVDIFNKKGQYISEFKIWNPTNSIINYSFGIHILGSQVFVAHHYSNRIQVFDLESLSLVRIFQLDKHETPVFLTSSRQGNIIITTKEETVVILDSNGYRIKTFGSFGSEDGQFMGIAGVCTNSRDQIIVADQRNNRIQIFDREGKFICLITHEKDYQSFSPCGVCVDKDDNIWTTDLCNSEILGFNPFGILIRIIKPILDQRESSLYFFDICCLEDRIFTSEWHNREIVIFNK